jgi:outer membrane protein
MKIALPAALLAATISVGANAQAAGSILTVDMQRVYQQCNACKTAQAQLETQQQQIKTFADQLGAPIRTEGEALQKSLAGKDPNTIDAATRTRIQALQTREQSANQQVQQRLQTLQATRNNVLSQINTKLGPIFNSVLSTRKGTVMVDLNSTLASAPAVDVTPDVLAQLNAQLPSISVTPPPAAAGAARPATGTPVGR